MRILAAATMVAMATAAVAGPLEDLDAAHKRNDYAAAVACLPHWRGSQRHTL
jgi:hypothetical protein